MARIFITGSSDGLGLMAARRLAEEGHQVVTHARNEQRAKAAIEKFTGAEDVVTGDLSSIEECIRIADAVNKLGQFDAVIHNAGVYQTDAKQIFIVNSLAPYILTCLIKKPSRLIYLSSSMHRSGKLHMDDLSLETGCNYSDSKLHVLMLAKYFAGNWTYVLSNAVDPGWVPTRMGGKGAPDNLDAGADTQAWLAVSEEDAAKVSGIYFHHRKPDRYLKISDDSNLQKQLIEKFKQLTKVELR